MEQLQYAKVRAEFGAILVHFIQIDIAEQIATRSKLMALGLFQLSKLTVNFCNLAKFIPNRFAPFEICRNHRTARLSRQQATAIVNSNTDRIFPH